MSRGLPARPAVFRAGLTSIPVLQVVHFTVGLALHCDSSRGRRSGRTEGGVAETVSIILRHNGVATQGGRLEVGSHPRKIWPMRSLSPATSVRPTT